MPLVLAAYHGGQPLTPSAPRLKSVSIANTVTHEHRVLVMRAGESRRVRRGHPWVYSNEIDNTRTPLLGFAAGDVTQLVEPDGGFVAWIDINPHAVLCGRVLSRKQEVVPDADWLGERLDAALGLRQRFYLDPYYRLVYGDADGLSGLVIDRYNDVFVVQVGSAGMEARLPLLVDMLVSRFAPRAVVLKNDGKARELEGLATYVRVAAGVFEDPVTVLAGGMRFTAPVLAGQKTGWYYDHADNRAWLGRLSLAGASVLDLYSYVGAWSLAAASAGASSVLAVDSSQSALAALAANAAANGLQRSVSTLAGDALQLLGEMKEAGRRFDVVILDPPAFIRRRADEKRGQDMYRKLNVAALNVLAAGGLMVSASCSALLSADDHVAAVRTAARQSRRNLAVVHRGGQSPDHPVLPTLDATEYLKCLFLKDMN